MASSGADPAELDRLGLEPGVLEDPRQVAVLAGAGISLAPPACLLAGGAFQDAILDRLVPADVDRAELSAALAVPELARPGEGVRFEQLMGLLVDTGLDRDLRVLDCLDACESPNDAHHLLAHLARSGATVMTVNFDRLIEIAWQGIDSVAALLVAAYDEDFAQPDLGAPVLWKLHGSLSLRGVRTRDSIQATLPAVLARGMSRHKRALLARTAAERDLLVIGYSGWDDFDIVPALAAVSTRRIVWVLHRTGEAPRVRTAADLTAEHHARSDLDVVAFRRLLFSRSSERLTVIEGDTGRVLEALAARWFPDGVPKKSYPLYRLDVDAYFDAWGASLRPLARRYAVLEALASRRAFRPQAATFHRSIALRVRRERERPDAEPRERLLALLDAYNGGGAPAPVRQKLRRLPRLEPEDECLALRLDAYLTWTLEGRNAGVAAFRRATRVARKHGDAAAEFITLLGWLLRAEHAAELPLWWAQDEEAPVNELVARFLPPDAPDLDRISELVEATGRQIDLWRTALDLREGDSAMGDLYAIFMEGISGELSPEEWQHELSTMTAVRRHSIDVGDVVGEARASLVLGGMYLCLNRPRSALQEHYRVLELGRIAALGGAGGWARVHAKHAVEFLVPGKDGSTPSMFHSPHPDRYEEARRIREHVQMSMWGRNDLPPTPDDALGAE